MTNDNDKSRLITELSAVMDALASVAGQHIEVVLHDLARPESSVIKIVNGHISGRHTGSSLLEGPENDKGFVGILNQDFETDKQGIDTFTDYPTVSLQGKPLRSSTVLFRDKSGTASLSLCFNADNSAVEAAREALAALLPAGHGIKDDKDTGLEEKMNEIIRICIPPSGHLKTGATKREKVEVVRLMQAKGMFIVRGGVEKAAKVLGVTRYTIYNYLDEIKNKRGVG